MMKRRILAAALAAVPVVLVVMIAVGTSQVEAPTSPDAQRNKFGFAEAVSPRNVSLDIAQAPTPAAMIAPVAPPRAPDAPRRSADGMTIPAADLSVSLPKIAYRYSYGFGLDPRVLPQVQREQADMCERLGPAVCRIVAMEQSGDGDDRAIGSLDLAVAAHRARSFGNELAKQAEASGGAQSSSSISGEDLSKQIVDTEARLRARTVLRDRLMEVLASRRGTVAELVEAERGVAQVNEEIDQARSWLAEMKGRVEYSAIHITYNSTAAVIQSERRGGFLAPIRSVIAALGGILGTLVALLIALGAIAAPLGVLAWGGRRLWQRYRPQSAVLEPA